MGKMGHGKRITNWDKGHNKGNVIPCWRIEEGFRCVTREGFLETMPFQLMKHEESAVQKARPKERKSGGLSSLFNSPA